MMDALHPDIAEATRLTRTGRLAEATALLQRVLHGQPLWGPGEADGAGPVLDLKPDAVTLGRAEVPSGARLVTGSYSNGAGTRSYRLFIPSRRQEQRPPLLVMLHGCTQSPDDLAAGTRMNLHAEERSWLVVYPAQDETANPQRCWNWFNPADQERDRGEPSLIAGITREIMREHGADPSRVYVAGMSAGGALAAVLAATYPDLYAAAGIHSGLPYGCASDMASAFAVMRQGADGLARRPARLVPTIVFHGDQDNVVHPGNGESIIRAARAAAPPGLQPTAAVQHGRAAGGHGYTRRVHADARGRPVLEHWLVHGGGHGWSGGSPAGTFTDPQGPDATREMIRFFQEHPHPG